MMAPTDQTLRARGQPAILADGVGKRLGEVRAVDGVDLELPVGKVLALLGEMGRARRPWCGSWRRCSLRMSAGRASPAST
jgi:ABC-type sulfate/molybdate transport systems ATPase subunit